MSARRVRFVDPLDAGYTLEGRVIADERRYAWTPADWTNEAPDRGMVRVIWDNDRQPRWEYEAGLTPV